jgi:hypothetical protein
VAWKNGYYYRNKRIGGKVVTEYIGNDLYAHLAQLQDDEQRQDAQERRQEWKAIVDADKQLDAQLDSLTEIVNAYAGAVLLVSGYHVSANRVWRKKR